MSICFTWFPINGLGKPKLYQNMWCFTRIGDFTWRCVWLWKIKWGKSHNWVCDWPF